MLAKTSAGVWSPEQDAHLWLKFSLRAHHLQAQTVAARMERVAIVREMLDAVGYLHGPPGSSLDLLFAAVTRPGVAILE